MSGFDNDVVNCKNWDFRETSPVQGQATSGGDLPIGTGGSPEIEVGQIVSSDGSITVSYSNPNIDISAGSSIPTTIVTDTGSATPVANILNLSGGAGIDTTGSGNTVTLVVDLTELPTVATTYAGDSGSATPAANTLTLAGGTGIDTTAAGSTVTFNFDETEVPAIATSYETQSGTAVPVNNVLQVDGVQETLTRGSGDTVSVFSPRVARYVVDPTTDRGTHTTIQGAIDDATAGDTIFVRPGTYTENLTMKAVNLSCYGGTGLSDSVKILGKITMSTAGTCILEGFTIETNSDNAIVNSGSAATEMRFTKCYIIASDTTAISYTNSNAASLLRFTECFFDVQTTGISLHTMTSPGNLTYERSESINTGSTTTASTNSAGTVGGNYFLSQIPFSCSSSGVLGLNYCFFDTSAINTTAVTTAGTGTSTILYARLDTGSATALTIGSGTTVDLFFCSIQSTNASGIGGAGTLNYGGVDFSDGAINISTTTVNGHIFRPGVTASQNQPAFSFLAGSNFTSVTGDGTAYIIPFGTTIFDQDGGYSSPNWIATYGGKYQLSAKILLYNLGSGHTAAEFRIVTSNRNYVIWTNPYGMRAVIANNFSTMAQSHLADVDAADLVSTLLVVYNSTKTVNVENSSSLSGVMVC